MLLSYTHTHAHQVCHYCTHTLTHQGVFHRLALMQADSRLQGVCCLFLLPTQRVMCHLSTIRPSSFSVTSLTSRPRLFETHTYISILYESGFPVHTHHRITLCMACLYRVVLPPASGTCNGVLSALRSHLRRASATFCTCECNMVTHCHILHKFAHSVTHTSDGATWYLTDTRTCSRAVSYHEAICLTQVYIYFYIWSYICFPHTPAPCYLSHAVLPISMCVAQNLNFS